MKNLLCMKAKEAVCFCVTTQMYTAFEAVLLYFANALREFTFGSPLVPVFGMGFVGFALFFLALKALSTEVLGLPSVSAHNGCYSFIHSWPMQPCVREYGQ